MPKRKDIYDNPDDSYERVSYKSADVKLELENKLRNKAMSFDEIKNFLSTKAERAGRGNHDGEYKVHDRTVIRMIQSIQASFPNGEFEVNITKPWKKQDYKLNLFKFPDNLTKEELDALVIAVEKTKKDKTINTHLLSLKTKLFSKWAIHQTEREQEDFQDQLDKITAVTMGPQLQTTFDTDIYSALTTAIHTQNKIIITYKNKNGEIKDHKICPLGFLHGPNNVYIVSFYCKKDETITTNVSMWIVSSIIGVKQPTDDYNGFSRESFDLKQYASSMFGIPHDDESRKSYDVVKWLIKNPKTILDAKKYKFYSDQEIIDNSDGTLTIQLNNVNNLPAIAKYLTQWEGDIIPIEPEELKTEYCKLLVKCLKAIPGYRKLLQECLDSTSEE